MRPCIILVWLPAIGILFAPPVAAADQTYRSHPPMRPMPVVSARPMDGGPALFVDPSRGDDTNAGSEARPWKSLGRAIKQSSAPAGEKRISAKQHAVAEIGDVSGSMAGDVQNIEREIESRYNDGVAFTQRLCSRGNALVGRTKHRNLSAQVQKIQQVLDAANMTCVMVCADDGRKLKSICAEVFDDWCRITRINDGGTAAFLNDPEIVILESRYRVNADCRNGGHTESVKI